MTAWAYDMAVEAVVRAARLADRRRRLRTCGCSALYLTPSMAPDADECGYCWRRWRREAEEAEDRRVYQLYLDGRGDHPWPSPVESDPQVQPEIQGALF